MDKEVLELCEFLFLEAVREDDPLRGAVCGTVRNLGLKL